MDHKLYTVQNLRQITGAEAVIANPDLTIRTLGTDSRKLTDIARTLFFALKGRRDGHDFIKDVYDIGVRSFIVTDKSFDITPFKDANFFYVADALKALQALGAYHRKQYNYPVIAITGSNGKTIVKEWLYQLIAPEYNIVRSPKSYNSQIGVPLSVWQMNEDHTLAIFETGISRSGEMEALESVIKPTIGILTTIGEAHNEGFESRDKKIGEKLALFKDTDLFIYSPKHLLDYTGEIPGKEKFTWGYETADLEIIDEEVLENKYQYLRGRFKENEIECVIPFTDAASVENAICCWATILALGYDPGTADARLEKLHSVKMRLELKNGINNCSIIDDSYSSDLSSLAIALDFLKQQNQHLKRTLILSDIPEGGMDQEQLYTQVAYLLENKNVDRLIGVGELISKHAGLFNVEKQFFDTTEELLSNLPDIKLSNETILLKGARVYQFERVSKALAQKMHETVLEINLNALENNLNFYKSLLRPKVKTMAIVKAFSYGSGSFEIANLLQFNKVDYLAVAYADEGVALRKAGITIPMMVMNADGMDFDTLIDNKLEPEIYSFRILKDFIEALNHKNQEQYPIHIKLDTGMHRLGFMPDELDILWRLLGETKAIHIKSVFSHLVGSEDESLDNFTRHQISQLGEMADKIEEAVGYKSIRHIANTSGISRWPEAQLDMVRLGIGLYGIDHSFGNKSPLSTVTSLKTTISQVKELKPGEAVGYNRKGQLPDGGKIATVKIGYADGYNRKLGNGTGKMLVNGKEVPTIGNICMDMSMLDITGMEVTEGDEVIVFNDKIRVEDIARQLDTIPYEVLTGISQRVKRVYYYE
jgi:alanine racemase